MVYDIIPIAIAALSLVALAVIVMRKFPALAAIDLENIPKERQMEVKKSLIENRLLEKIRAGQKKARESVKPLESAFKNAFYGLRDKMKAVEDKYRGKQRDLLKGNPELTEQKIKRLFHEAEEHMKSEDLAEAEKRYIEIVKLDSQNVEACRNLGYIYLKQKDYRHAREMFEYNLRVGQKAIDEEAEDESGKKKMVSAYRDLGTAYRASEEYDRAMDNFKKAYDLEPKSPKNLDLLIETSIMLGEGGRAKEYLARLEETNPDNQKIGKFREQIENM